MKDKIAYLENALPVFQKMAVESMAEYIAKEKNVVNSANLACDLEDLYSVRDAIQELDVWFEANVANHRNNYQNLESIFHNIDTAYNSISKLENHIPELKMPKKQVFSKQMMHLVYHNGDLIASFNFAGDIDDYLLSRHVGEYNYVEISMLRKTDGMQEYIVYDEQDCFLGCYEVQAKEMYYK